MTAPVFGVVGWKNSGKTTLVVRLIETLTARGFEVAAVKHAHHAFDVDYEGRDSFRYRQAGASTVAVSSRLRFAIMTELRGRSEPTLDELTQHLGYADIVLVEGFKGEKHPKLEVRRQGALDRTPLAPNDPAIVAVAADFEVAAGPLPVFDLNDTAGIADLIINKLMMQG